MKVLNKRQLKRERQLKYAISECKIMKLLEHPFVVKLFYAFQNSKQIFIVLEYCSGGDLINLIES